MVIFFVNLYIFLQRFTSLPIWCSVFFQVSWLNQNFHNKMTAAYFVNKKEKLLMLIMSTGKKMPWLREENKEELSESII